jgi:HPt (histidine-containing phosphotransfer) domain-containing protein
MSKKIIIDVEESKESFGEETFESMLKMFVDGYYETTVRNLQDAFSAQDRGSMKHLTHTLKTYARFLCSEEFALECQAIENCVKEGAEDWEKIGTLFPQFIEDYAILYHLIEELFKEHCQNKEPTEEEFHLDTKAPTENNGMQMETEFNTIEDDKPHNIQPPNQTTKPEITLMTSPEEDDYDVINKDSYRSITEVKGENNEDMNINKATPPLLSVTKVSQAGENSVSPVNPQKFFMKKDSELFDKVMELNLNKEKSNLFF